MDLHSPRRAPRDFLLLIGLTALAGVVCALSSFGLLSSEGNRQAAAIPGTPPLAPTYPIGPIPAPTLLSSPTIPPTARPTATDTPAPTRTSTPKPTVSPLPGTHFLLGRPVGSNANEIVPDWTYLYGDTEHGTLEVHHGEEFVNPLGTPVLAAADGTVVTAGDDKFPLCGARGDQLCGPMRNYYGLAVVVQLDQAYAARPVFALCGHMDSVGVQVGQHVRAGDVLGTIGMTGVAIGPHCHFEVRLGVNDYYHTRNPILWIKPLPGTGVLAARVLNRQGVLIPGAGVFVYKDNAAQDAVFDNQTYGRDDQPPVNSDDVLRENWALGDLPAGPYLVRVPIGGVNYYQHVTVADGQLTLFTIQPQ